MTTSRGTSESATGSPRRRDATEPPPWTRLLPGASARLLAPMRLVERNVVAAQGNVLTFISVFLEPVLFLLSIGIGVGALVGDVAGPAGTPVPYKSFVAAGLLATSAMFGPVFDCTFAFFVRFKYVKSYHAVMATPLRPADIAIGEVLWSFFRSAVYALAFLVTMAVLGLVSSWWALLCLPASMLISYAFGGAGLGAATFMRSWTDFDLVNVAILPMFLFSATFFPLEQYPEVLQWVVRVTPLYQGVVLERGLAFGQLQWSMVLNAAYLVVMGTVGLRVAGRRLTTLLQP
jgi:lipooligosaccharide transport system permease protein